jgi:hypothetical protein
MHMDRFRPALSGFFLTMLQKGFGSRGSYAPAVRPLASEYLEGFTMRAE